MWSPLNGTLKNTLSGPPYRRFFSVLGKNWALCFFVTTLALLWQSLGTTWTTPWPFIYYLDNTWAIHGQYNGTLWAYLVTIYLGIALALLGRYFGATWAIFGHCLGTAWALRGQKVLEITRKYKKEPGTIIYHQKLPENTQKYQIVKERMWCVEISWQIF